MLLQTILNRVHKIKGFVYGAVRCGEWNGDPTLEVEVRAAERNGRATDPLEPRRFEFIPLWGHRVFLRYRMRRVGGVSRLRGHGGAGSVDGGEERNYPAVSVAPGRVGEADVLERSDVGVPHELAHRVSGGGESGGLGPGAHEFRRCPGAGDRRDAIRTGAPVPNGGVSPDQSCEKTPRSRTEPMNSLTPMFRNHRELILNWFRARKEFFSAGVEGLNNQAKFTMKKAYGYKSFHTLEIALYHTLGNLPEPKFTRRF